MHRVGLQCKGLRDDAGDQLHEEIPACEKEHEEEAPRVSVATHQGATTFFIGVITVRPMEVAHFGLCTTNAVVGITVALSFFSFFFFGPRMTSAAV